MKSAFLLNVVVSDCPSVLEALSGEDESLLVAGNALFVLDLALHTFNAVACLCLNCDSLSGQRSHENLHSSPESEDQVDGRLLLDVVISHSPTVFKALSGEDEPLLVDGDALLCQNPLLHGTHAVAVLHFHGDGLSGEGAHEYLDSSPESEHEMHRALLLDVVVAEAALILELLAAENQSLLVGGDAFPAVDELLQACHSVSCLHLARNGLSCKSLNEDLHLFNDYRGLPGLFN